MGLLTLRRQGLAGSDVDFEKTWGALETAFREIHTKNASGLSYEEIYRHAYQVVLKKKGGDLYKRVSAFEHDWLSKDVRTSIQGYYSPQLLANVQSLVGSTASERRVAGENFLRGLNDAYAHHQVCMSMLADVLMYMVRHFLVKLQL